MYYFKYLLFLVLVGSSFGAAAVTVTVDIRGVEHSLAGELQNAVTLARQKDSERLTPALIKVLFDRAPGELQEALKVRGYYKAKIDSELSHKNGQWQATFKIDRGPSIRITRLTLEITGPGHSEKELRQALSAFPLRQGERLDQGEYELGKRSIRNAARQLGYLDGTWKKHVIEIDPATDSARIDLELASGTRYKFGPIELPDTVVANSVLKHMEPFKTGDPYDARKVIAFQQKLRDSDYFRDVDVSPELNRLQGHQIPIRVRLSPNKPNVYRVGAGYGTDTGPRLSASWNRRYLNRYGHRFHLDLKLAPVTSSLTGTYLIPYFLGKPQELGFTAMLAHQDTTTSTSNSFQVGVKRLMQRWGWNETTSLNYAHENFTVGNQTGVSDLLMPAIGYWRSKADDPVYPRNGYRLSVDLRGAARYIVSNVSFAQVVIQGKYIRGLGNGRVVLRGALGATAVTDFKRLPPTLRFFAGGENSIRGFGYQSLGPRDAAGNVVGGRYLAVGSVGYEHMIWGNWGAAVFSDFGNAFDSFKRNTFAYSVGVGLRWRSPVGLVRVDVATGLSDPSHPVHLDLEVGPEL